MGMSGPAYVAVCGPGVADEQELAWAEEVGRLVARAGAVLVCGGTTGVMDAAAKGATSEGGIAVGILPGVDRSEASPHLSLALPTGMGEGRNLLLVRAADVVIAIAGEFGTLSEIALALKIGKPVVGLSTWDLSRAGEPVDAFPRAAIPTEAVSLALDLVSDSTNA
jgi:uncharacterized protein (TIGR00725 family)